MPEDVYNVTLRDKVEYNLRVVIWKVLWGKQSNLRPSGYEYDKLPMLQIRESEYQILDL